ncbi:hypothetical protein B0T24DRAFT_600802 [Lasiosphaeria ovina]|uniref:Uncharacterized protein n=1 Tax=Lasiosphaeria ovina TaxID=92902 RepID=A0AAE0NIW1_9PEZI|nr:hypothetical protein B0T24DRAFT_600802 [Lasiosphaeria ovina]
MGALRAELAAEHGKAIEALAAKHGEAAKTLDADLAAEKKRRVEDKGEHEKAAASLRGQLDAATKGREDLRLKLSRAEQAMHEQQFLAAGLEGQIKLLEGRVSELGLAKTSLETERDEAQARRKEIDAQREQNMMVIQQLGTFVSQAAVPGQEWVELVGMLRAAAEVDTQADVASPWAIEPTWHGDTADDHALFPLGGPDSVLAALHGATSGGLVATNLGLHLVALLTRDLAVASSAKVDVVLQVVGAAVDGCLQADQDRISTWVSWLALWQLAGVLEGRWPSVAGRCSVKPSLRNGPAQTRPLLLALAESLDSGTVEALYRGSPVCQCFETSGVLAMMRQFIVADFPDRTIRGATNHQMILEGTTWIVRLDGAGGQGYNLCLEDVCDWWLEHAF